MTGCTPLTALMLVSLVLNEEGPRQQSLAQLARSTRSSKNSAGQERVITNQDLRDLQAHVSTGERSQLEQPASISVASNPGPPEPLKPTLSDEVLRKWSLEFAEARADLKLAVNQGFVLQLRMNQVRNTYLSRTDGATQEKLQAILSETAQRIEENREAQRIARTAIDILRAKARAAGLNPRQIGEMVGRLPDASLQITPRENGLQ